MVTMPAVIVPNGVTNLPPKSRYNECPLYSAGTLQVILGWKNSPINAHSSDQVHMVTAKDEHRLDLVAHEFYRDSTLWWVIAKRNNLPNPRILPVKTLLMIPTHEHFSSLDWGKRRT